MCAVKNLYTGAMTGYIYGADGMRVSMGTISTWGSCDPAANGYQAMKDSILDPSGGQLTETGVDANGQVAWAHTNVWAGGQLLATYDPNGIHFYLNDWTGSRRVETDYQGVVEQTCANLPFGDGETCAATPSETLYAGLDRDSESGLDHAMFRQYSSVFGQWTTPDPYGGSASVYNPQSLNRYAYVRGSPLGATDRSGLDPGLDFGVSYLGSAAATSNSFLGGLLGEVLGPIGVFADAGEAIADIGQSLGWWSFGPTFHGNVQASQSGKNVPSAPSSQRDGFADCGCIAGQGLFHSPEAQQIWGNADYGVETVTRYAAQAYLGAFTLGLGAGPGVGSLGLEGGATATTSVFWSGAGAQAAATGWASANGATTLEMTALGQETEAATQGLDWITQARPMWVSASQDFASSASGDVYVFQGPWVRLDSVWATTEYPALLTNPNVTNIIFMGVGW